MELTAEKEGRRFNMQSDDSNRVSGAGLDESQAPPPLDLSMLLGVYRAMVTARQVDWHEADFVRRGEAFFHIPGVGHEPIAALGPHLTVDDWIAAHLRTGASL
jgi:TPP-dependent pyruvate/acetoin dehydrogenase alpha subunit